MDLYDFLRKYSNIDSKFIKDFFDSTSASKKQTDLTIDLDIVAKWLEVKEKKLRKILMKSYKKDIDYKIKLNKKIDKQYIVISSDVFKLLCLKIGNKKADSVRHFYLEIENLLIRYYEFLIETLEMKINYLENENKN